MKKICVIILILTLCCTVFLSSCKRKDKFRNKDNEDKSSKTSVIDFNINFSSQNIKVYEGETVDILISTNNEKIDFNKLNLEYDNSIINVNISNSKIIINAMKKGKTKILISLDDYDLKYEIDVEVIDEESGKISDLTYNDVPSILTVDESFTITYSTQMKVNAFWSSSDSEVLMVVNGKITGLKKGNAVVTLTLSTIDTEVIKTWNIEVKDREKEIISLVDFNNVPTSICIDETFLITYTTNVLVTAEWFTSNKDVLDIIEGKICGIKEGSAKITLILSSKDDRFEKSWDIIVEKPVIDNTEPTFILDGVEKDITLSWGKIFKPLEGIKAIDNIDGDITDKISVDSNVNSKSYGTYNVTYTVKDKAGNEAKLVRKVEVVWDYAVKFIGHAGSFFGAQNSEEACVYALKELKYQSLECDLKRTKDGIFVCSHNDAFTGVDGTSYTIANYTLKELEAKTFKERRAGLSGVEAKTYEFKVMTLEKYLEICKEYNATAIIELKGCNGVSQSDQSGMKALMELIDDCGMMDQTIFLASAYNCLIWARENGYSLPCQYLMNTCDSEEAFNRCVKYHLDISICVTYGPYIDKFSQAEREAYKTNWIRRYQAAGCEVSVWTFTQYCDYKMVQEWIDFGVDWVTCDWQQMDKLNLPASSKITHTVTFLNYDGSILQKVDVKDGKSCYTPLAPKREDFEFIGWGQDLSCVTSDLTVTAQYKAIPHKWNITYDLNGGYFDLNPRVEGTKIGSVTTNANSNYYVDYLSNVFLYHIN